MEYIDLTKKRLSPQQEILERQIQRVERIKRQPEDVQVQSNQQRIMERARQGIRKERRDNIVKQYNKVNRVTNKVSRNMGKAFENIKDAVTIKPQASKNLLGYSNAFNAQTAFSGGPQSQSHSGPGRPRNSLKWRSPFNGQPIAATEYYKQVRAYRRIQTNKAQVQPQNNPQIQQMVQNRMMQQNVQQMQPQQNQLPQSIQPVQSINQNQDINQMPNGIVIPKGTDVWRWRRGIVDTQVDILGNKKQVLRGIPESFWN
jgi:exonuclease VII large subunit